MEEKKVLVGEKEVTVHEMLATDFDSLSGIEDNVEGMRILHTKSCDISVDDYNTLTLKERNLLTKAINEVNGWGTEEVIDIDKKKI